MGNWIKAAIPVYRANVVYRTIEHSYSAWASIMRTVPAAATFCETLFFGFFCRQCLTLRVAYRPDIRCSASAAWVAVNHSQSVEMTLIFRSKVRKNGVLPKGA